MPYIARKIASRSKDKKILVDGAMTVGKTGFWCCARRVVSFGAGRFFYPEDRTVLQVGSLHFQIDPHKLSGGEKKFHPADCFETEAAFAYLTFQPYTTGYLLGQGMSREQGYAEQLRQAQWEVYVNRKLDRNAYAMVIGGKVRVLVEYCGNALDQLVTPRAGEASAEINTIPFDQRIAWMQQAVQQMQTLAAKGILITDCALDNMAVQGGQLSLIDFSGCVQATSIRLGERPRKFPYLDASTRETNQYTQASANYSLALCLAQVLPEWFEVTRPGSPYGSMTVKAKIDSTSLPLDQARLMKVLAAMLHADSADARPGLAVLSAAIETYKAKVFAVTTATGLLAAAAPTPQTLSPEVKAGDDLSTPRSEESDSDHDTDADDDVLSTGSGDDASFASQQPSVAPVFQPPADVKIEIYHDGKGIGVGAHQVDLSTVYDESSCLAEVAGVAVATAEAKASV